MGRNSFVEYTLKKIKNFKITFILAISSVAILTAYLFQKPFAASSYADYRPRWNKSQLSSLRDDFENKEKTYPNLKKECDKKINFNGPKPVTDFSFVYVPGFSATRKEIFPVVESLAKQFSANYFLTRFAAHGEAADDFKGYQAQSFY